jgi:hypothetical protein
MKIFKRVALWKWIIIILLVVGMPLFFAFSRNFQIQQAIQDTSANNSSLQP